ncbi:Zinc/iron permease [Mycena albidolilacea]|uniref:Zinc/iron permease n=1 Tax=Mycena albidolilacea TaxID=1033008 RepID=A0AAD7F3P6_9AGAR|nr:Zinc/iron permease [Mycena albidolilacea]
MFALLVMSALLGASSFLFGMIPLSFVLSKHHITRFSTLGSGILIGTALGVIIPEGIETLAQASDKLPTSQIALSLIFGFIFMLVIEQLVAPHSHSHSHTSTNSGSVALHTVGQQSNSTVEFDAEMGDLEQPDPPSNGGFMQADASASLVEIKASRAKAYPLTFGLIMHGLADGLALGVSSLSAPSASFDSSHRDLSFIVFLALIIHKAPTSLALTTSLLNTSLPRPECRKHLAFFSASTPLGAITTYALLSFFSAGGQGSWPGIALLVSGGTFLYVATVLQTVSHAEDDPNAGDLSPTVRVSLIAAGMILPYMISHLLFPDVH